MRLELPIAVNDRKTTYNVTRQGSGKRRSYKAQLTAVNGENQDCLYVVATNSRCSITCQHLKGITTLGDRSTCPPATCPPAEEILLGDSCTGEDAASETPGMLPVLLSVTVLASRRK